MVEAEANQAASFVIQAAMQAEVDGFGKDLSVLHSKSPPATTHIIDCEDDDMDEDGITEAQTIEAESSDRESQGGRAGGHINS